MSVSRQFDISSIVTVHASLLRSWDAGLSMGTALKTSVGGVAGAYLGCYLEKHLSSHLNLLNVELRFITDFVLSTLFSMVGSWITASFVNAPLSFEAVLLCHIGGAGAFVGYFFLYWIADMAYYRFLTSSPP